MTNELGLRRAFAALLDTLGKGAGWTLVEEQGLANRKRPDGTLYDALKMPRGYWEAKDGDDDLEAEIRRKIERRYPLTNTIFEDTRRAVLYQNERRVAEADLARPAELGALLAQFFAHTRAQIEEFYAAVREFQQRIPELARGMVQIIEGERARNPRFVGAFEEFQRICRSAIDPEIGDDTVEELLVQHLLTERLFRTIFDDPDFTRRNVIAAEIEKVIAALTSRSFNRSSFLKALDCFYLAIEQAAATIDDFAQKQTFLNTVYERFFQGFSRSQADTHGVVYTPQPIVDFMVASVDEVLQREWGLSLSSPGVAILDPATGTGNFIVNILRRVSRRDLKRKYREELFANEIMLLPYYIASLNIERAFYDLAGEYEPFEGICFADTLDLAESNQLPLFAEENTERIARQKNAPITVIIGNPPYNVGQRNENDNNKNRKYPVIDKRLAETYVKDSKATLRNQLYDVYVRFFRWASDRLQGRDGIVCFVSNNSFVDQLTFDGMRNQLLQDFTQIYHLDLHGNVRKNPKLSGTTHNVFGIQVGVGITIAIRNAKSSKRFIKYHRVPEVWTRTEKLDYIARAGNNNGIDWTTLSPDARNTWRTEGMQADFASFLPLGSKEAKAQSEYDATTVFKRYSGGIKANRDDWVYDFDRAALGEKMLRFIDFYNSEVDRWQRRSDRSVPVDDFVTYDDTKAKWTGDLKIELIRGNYATYSTGFMRNGLYRPFTKKYLYFDELLLNSRYLQHLFFPTLTSEVENTVIVISDVAHRSPFSLIITNTIPELHLLATSDGFQCFPFYVYDEDGGNRRENITDWALAQFRAAYGPAAAGEEAHQSPITKRDVFHYVYGLLHHPAYRERYAENLKRELPRIPLVPGGDWRQFADTGAKLAELHLGYESAPEHPLKWGENRDVPFSWRVAKMKLSPDKTALVVNESLTLAGIPPAALRYRLGNRSALEWLIDQYQVSTDKRSGIVSDPNRADDEEYIVRLVGRVITVSVETIRLLDALPAWAVAAPS